MLQATLARGRKKIFRGDKGQKTMESRSCYAAHHERLAFPDLIFFSVRTSLPLQLLNLSHHYVYAGVHTGPSPVYWTEIWPLALVVVVVGAQLLDPPPTVMLHTITLLYDNKLKNVAGSLQSTLFRNTHLPRGSKVTFESGRCLQLQFCDVPYLSTRIGFLSTHLAESS